MSDPAREPEPDERCDWFDDEDLDDEGEPDVEWFPLPAALEGLDDDEDDDAGAATDDEAGPDAKS